jgi:DNA processing protein
MTAETEYLHALNLLPQLGPKRLLQLFRYFENFSTAFAARPEELLAAGLTPSIVKALQDHCERFDMAAARQALIHHDIHVLDFRDAEYPRLLLEIPQFPPLLYYRGDISIAAGLCLAVVGTRRPSTYGRSITPGLIAPLAQVGMTIVSGLAYGIDRLAHQAAIDANGRTIAIIGSGLDEDTLYPKDHRLLASTIINHGGLLLSEYPPGIPALKQHFVARNRIIAGLSVGTLVIECDTKSGALITAQHCLDQNRTVYAVPGPIYAPTSAGPNNLLKMGAKPVTEAQDIYTDLNISVPQISIKTADATLELTANERILVAYLSNQPMTADELVSHTQLEPHTVVTTLTFLEMKGIIRNLGAQQYVLTGKSKP